jgi:hypothetical protein
MNARLQPFLFDDSAAFLAELFQTITKVRTPAHAYT